MTPRKNTQLQQIQGIKIDQNGRRSGQKASFWGRILSTTLLAALSGQILGQDWDGDDLPKKQYIRDVDKTNLTIKLDPTIMTNYFTEIKNNFTVRPPNPNLKNLPFWRKNPFRTLLGPQKTQ